MFNLIKPKAHWLLRAAVSSVFVFHGTLKLVDLKGFAAMLPISFTEVVLVALAETVGGILVLAGGFTRFQWADLATRAGAAMIIPVMVGAIWIVHWGRWNFLPSESHPIGGVEFQVVLLLTLIFFVITGNDDTENAVTA